MKSGENTTGTQPNVPETTVVMDGTMVEAALHRIAQEIVEANPDLDNIVLLGVLSRGRPLANRLMEEVRELTGHELRVGSLATTLYRDDLRSGGIPAIAGNETHFDFDIHGATVILVDDVLSTGRTVRAALDEIIDYGRPARIQLACLVDRGLRELPIQADYLGWTISTRAEDHVAVHVRELDGEDAVLHERPVAATNEGEP